MAAVRVNAYVEIKYFNPARGVHAMKERKGRSLHNFIHTITLHSRNEVCRKFSASHPYDNMNGGVAITSALLLIDVACSLIRVVVSPQGNVDCVLLQDRNHMVLYQLKDVVVRKVKVQSYLKQRFY